MLLIKNSAASFSSMWKTLRINFLNLFNEAIQYASTIPEISDSDRAIIKHSRKTLLFHNNQHLEKKSGNPDFDIPIGWLWWSRDLWISGNLYFDQIKGALQNPWHHNLVLQTIAIHILSQEVKATRQWNLVT